MMQVADSYTADSGQPMGRERTSGMQVGHGHHLHFRMRDDLMMWPSGYAAWVDAIEEKKRRRTMFKHRPGDW